MSKIADAFCNLIGKFLLSPWGLILPATGIALLLLAIQLAKLTPALAENYAQRLIDCSDSEVGELVETILRLGDSGIPALVSGLRSERESVFFACRNALQRNLERWAEQRESFQNEHYRRLTEALLKDVDEFKPIAMIATAEFVDRILRETARHQEAGGHNSAAVATNCERLLQRIRSIRQRMNNPTDASTAPISDSIVRWHRNTTDPTLIAAEEPIGTLPDTNDVDEFALPRAELLHAYHQSSAFRQQAETPYRRPGLEIAPTRVEESQGELMASMGPSRPMNETLAVAETQGKVAARFELESAVEKIAENYVTDGSKPSPLDRNGEPFQTTPAPTNGSDDLLPEELKRIAPERIPTLPTTRLMRLLQHGDDRIVTAARKTLVGRDGFQETHLKLAFRLYHPLPMVRLELIDQLPSVGGIQQSVWLTELLNDPNGNVRFRSASAIATTSDPAMLRLLVDKGKRDADPRIVELAERINEQQRKIRR